MSSKHIHDVFLTNDCYSNSTDRLVQLVLLHPEGRWCGSSLPEELGNFDLTPCCVRLSVCLGSGKLLWSIPFLVDIASGSMNATPYMQNGDVRERKLQQTLMRVIKYSARGFCPTNEFMQLIQRWFRESASI
jgi:hypothetical protein